MPGTGLHRIPTTTLHSIPLISWVAQNLGHFLPSQILTQPLRSVRPLPGTGAATLTLQPLMASFCKLSHSPGRQACYPKATPKWGLCLHLLTGVGLRQGLTQSRLGLGLLVKPLSLLEILPSPFQKHDFAVACRLAGWCSLRALLFLDLVSMCPYSQGLSPCSSPL